MDQKLAILLLLASCSILVSPSSLGRSTFDEARLQLQGRLADLQDRGKISSALQTVVQQQLDAADCNSDKPLEALIDQAFVLAGEEMSMEAALQIIGDANLLQASLNSGACD